MARAHTRRYVVYAVATFATAGLWAVTTVPTGFAVVELASFVGPGAVLAISAHWTRNLLFPERAERRRAARAALGGALLLPPVLAFGIAFLSAYYRSSVVLIFVLGAWAALGGGLVLGAIEWVWKELRSRRHVTRSHLTLIRVATNTNRQRARNRGHR